MGSDNQSIPRDGTRPTRRAVLAALLAAPLQRAQDRPADLTLSIERARIEVAPGRLVATTTYNGAAPTPPIRFKEGVPACVEIINRTDATEYVHWHGFEAPPELDGTEEEGSLAVPAGGHLRYELMPLNSGSRYVHSHAMAMGDLSRGVYSGQFAFVYVEPKRDPGRYDQEIILVTHEWEPRLVAEQESES